MWPKEMIEKFPAKHLSRRTEQQIAPSIGRSGLCILFSLLNIRPVTRNVEVTGIPGGTDVTEWAKPRSDDEIVVGNPVAADVSTGGPRLPAQHATPFPGSSTPNHDVAEGR